MSENDEIQILVKDHEVIGPDRSDFHKWAILQTSQLFLDRIVQKAFKLGLSYQRFYYVILTGE